LEKSFSGGSGRTFKGFHFLLEIGIGFSLFPVPTTKAAVIQVIGTGEGMPPQKGYPLSAVEAKGFLFGVVTGLL
jgi:hypothetical protein